MKLRSAALLVFGALALAATPAGAQFSIPWYSSDGGGALVTGGDFALTGTIGQTDASSVSGSEYAVDGGFWGGGAAVLVGVADEPALLPARLEFGPPSPNPSAGSVAFSVALPRAASVDLSVFDVTGRQVHSVGGVRMEAGFHRLRWDGRGAGGQRGQPGVYFARLVVDGDLVGGRRFVLVR